MFTQYCFANTFLVKEPAWKRQLSCRKTIIPGLMLWKRRTFSCTLPNCLSAGVLLLLVRLLLVRHARSGWVALICSQQPSHSTFLGNPRLCDCEVRAPHLQQGIPLPSLGSRARMVSCTRFDHLRSSPDVARCLSYRGRHLAGSKCWLKRNLLFWMSVDFARFSWVTVAVLKSVNFFFHTSYGRTTCFWLRLHLRKTRVNYRCFVLNIICNCFCRACSTTLFRHCIVASWYTRMYSNHICSMHH